MPGGTRSYEMARRLVAMGHEVNMVTSWREPNSRKDWFTTDEDGIQVHWLSVSYSNHMSYNQRIKAFLKFAWGSALKAASMPADVVFATSTPLTIALPGVYAAHRQKVPMVFEVRDLWPDVPYAMRAINNNFVFWAAKQLEKFAYRKSEHIICLTSTMRDFISGKGITLSKITSIPNLANLDAFRVGRKRDDGMKVILYCGNLGPAHGPEYLVELAKYFYDHALNIKIEVIGGGKLLESLKNSSAHYGCIDKTIVFHGPKPKNQVDDFFLGADATIMTITDCELLYRHSVQNKFFDSLAAGKPVIANYRGYASELAEIMNAGLIVDRNDIVAAASQIAEYLVDQEVTLLAGKNARKLAEERFSQDKLGAQLEQVLLRAVENYSNRCNR